MGPDTQADITRIKDEDVVSYLVELKRAGKKQSLTLDANGKFLPSDKN
jgi:hypothetical protein